MELTDTASMDKRVLVREESPFGYGRAISCKDEQASAGAITQEPGLVLIPTFSTRRQGVKVYVYSQHPRSALSQAAELGRRLCDECDAGKGGWSDSWA
jgi:hypothetical protein